MAVWRWDIFILEYYWKYYIICIVNGCRLIRLCLDCVSNLLSSDDSSKLKIVNFYFIWCTLTLWYSHLHQLLMSLVPDQYVLRAKFRQLYAREEVQSKINYSFFFGSKLYILFYHKSAWDWYCWLRWWSWLFFLMLLTFNKNMNFFRFCIRTWWGWATWGRCWGMSSFGCFLLIAFLLLKGNKWLKLFYMCILIMWLCCSRE
jgi:hypothetical protein